MARISDAHWDGLVAFLNSKEPSGDPNLLLEAMRENWTDVIDEAKMIREQKLVRLGLLKDARDDQDARRAGLDQEIADLERDTRTP